MPIYEYRCRGCSSRLREVRAGRGGQGRVPVVRQRRHHAQALASSACAATAARSPRAMAAVAAVAVAAAGAAATDRPALAVIGVPSRRARPGPSSCGCMDLRRLEIFVRRSPSSAASPAPPRRSSSPSPPSPSTCARSRTSSASSCSIGSGGAPPRRPRGQLLLGYARRMLALAREAQQAIDQFQGRVSGELIVGGSSIPGEYVLPALDRRLPGQVPRRSRSRSSSATVAGAGVGRGGTGGDRRRRRAPHRAESREPPAHGRRAGRGGARPSTRGRPERCQLEDIKPEPLILRERGSGSRETLERALSAVGLDFGAFRIVGEMGSTQAIKQAIRAGCRRVADLPARGRGRVPRAAARAASPSSDLDVSRAFHLVTHRDRSRSPLAQAFLVFVEAQSLDRPA